jgi:Ca2+-binding EF-hand superfamily protein
LQNALNERRGADGHIPADDIRIQRLFNEYDTNRDGRLTLSDFLRFYSEKSVNQTEVVWQNLQAHGIGHDLLPEIKN